MFRTILIGVFTLVHLYVFWRTASVPFVSRNISKKLLVGVCVVLWVGFFFALFFGHGGGETLAATLELLSMNWLGILFLAFIKGVGFGCQWDAFCNRVHSRGETTGGAKL